MGRKVVTRSPKKINDKLILIFVFLVLTSG